MGAFVISLQGLCFWGVLVRKDRGAMWRNAPEVQNSSSWSSAGSGGVAAVLPSSPFHFLPGCGYCPPPPTSAEFDPWADVLLRRSSMRADLCVCGAVLHHSALSARKLNSCLVSWVLLRCSAKLNPPRAVLSRLHPSKAFPCLWGCGWNFSGFRRGRRPRLISLPKMQLRLRVSVHAQKH